MLPATNSGVGMNVGFPDVCETPVGPVPVPIPYPNMAMSATAVPFAETVFLSYVPALNMGAEAPITLGDQAGVDSPFMGPGRFTLGNPTVNVEAMPAINLTCPTTGNDMINAVGAVLVPSVTNVFYSHAGVAPAGAGEGGGDRVDAAALRRLSRAVVPGAPAAEALLPGGVAYAAVPVFSACVPARVYGLFGRWPGALALILDLRGNPGGELVAAVELAGDFLDEGAVIAIATDGDGDATVYRARRPRPYRCALALLVDRFTASAAELFAGSLQAHGRALVVGETTYGKGSAQSLVAGFAEPGARYATLAAMTLPGGIPLQGRGTTPDVVVEAPALVPAPSAAEIASPDGLAARLATDRALASALAGVQAVLARAM
jgi:carboxyl-terminal processing protease